MKNEKVRSKKWPVWKIAGGVLVIILVTGGIYLYKNFNTLLSEALLRNFNSSVISDVYELRFEDLSVNLAEGNIRVYNVSVLPREKPVKDYPYINSSFSLKTDNILLERVEIRKLLKENKLVLKTIQITKPEIEFLLNGTRHVMLPFKDTTAVATTQTKDSTKRPIESFGLTEFKLIDAAFHSKNSNKQREFKVDSLNITVHDLLLHQEPLSYLASLSQVKLSIGNLQGELKSGGIRHLHFKDFKIGIDSLQMELMIDTLMYQFDDFHTKLKDLDIQTADSIFQIAMKTFNLSYKDKSIELKDVRFKPNVSHAVIQSDFKFQHTEFSGSVGNLALTGVNFDSLLYAEKVFIDRIELKNVQAEIFKDKTKPIDSARFPKYLGQTIRAVKMPFKISYVKATDVHLKNTERKPDSTYATIQITRAAMEVKNITNLAPRDSLVASANAYLEDKAHFKATLAFLYNKPMFSFRGTVEKFKLTDLNPLLQAYSPAKIEKGTADEITFSGIAQERKATGTMKFLYHNLEVDLKLKEKAKWKSAVLAFAANTVVNSSNPGNPDLPPRVVKFKVDRDMNKGFINVILRSVLNGVKETMIMNKENRKAYQKEREKKEK